jgi:hypothetical protein
VRQEDPGQSDSRARRLDSPVAWDSRVRGQRTRPHRSMNLAAGVAPGRVVGRRGGPAARPASGSLRRETRLPTPPGLERQAPQPSIRTPLALRGAWGVRLFSHQRGGWSSPERPAPDAPGSPRTRARGSPGPRACRPSRARLRAARIVWRWGPRARRTRSGSSRVTGSTGRAGLQFAPARPGSTYGATSTVARSDKSAKDSRTWPSKSSGQR